MIYSFAYLLAHTFPKGSVYRTGGDEFIVILEDTDEKRIQSFLEVLENKTDTFNKSHRFSVSYAHGYVLSVTGKYATPEELQKISDKHMYQRKQYMKENGLCAMR